MFRRVILFCLFFTPTLNYITYFLVIYLFLLIYESRISVKALSVLPLIVFGISIFLLRELFELELLNLKDIFRYSTVCILILSRFRVDQRDFTLILWWYVVVQFLWVSYQWLDPYSDVHKWLIGSIYSEGHYTGGIRLRYPRASGLQSNIIESGFISIITIIFLYSKNLEVNKFSRNLLILLSFLTLLGSQSKSLVILGLIIALILLFSRSKLMFSFAILLPLFYHSEIAEALRGFDQFTRLGNGMQISSFQHRINLWMLLLSATFNYESILDALIGIGSYEVLGLFEGQTLDSDLFYSLQLFGLSAIVVIMPLVLILFSRILESKLLLIKLVFIILFSSSLVLDIFWNVKLLILTIVYVQAWKRTDIFHSGQL